MFLKTWEEKYFTSPTSICDFEDSIRLCRFSSRGLHLIKSQGSWQSIIQADFWHYQYEQSSNDNNLSIFPFQLLTKSILNLQSHNIIEW